MTTLRALGLALGVILATRTAEAHFVWAALEAPGEEGARAHVYFGEDPYPDSPEYLDGLTKLKTWQRSAAGEYTALELEKVVTDDGGSLTSAVPADARVVEADCLYGTFSRGDRSMLLHYYAKALTADAGAELARSEKLALDVVPRIADGVLRLSVRWKGEAAAGCQVIVSPPRSAATEHESDAEGRVSVDAPHPGRYQIRVRRIEERGGEFEGETYDETRHYCTVTFSVPGNDVAAIAAGSAAPAPAAAKMPEYPDLPRGITSFGAAVIGDWLYLYGGHFGRAHHYSNTSQSNELRRLSLAKPGSWEAIAEGPRLQGLAMVAHGGRLYRVGGFTAHNEEGEEHDLRSVDDFVAFDPATEKWETLPALPEPRSSHDAVVLGDKLYAIGGWQLGGEEPDWHETAWVVDLSQKALAWKELPAPPFQRRALSLGQLDGRVYAIGGMQETGGPTTRVDIFDPAGGTWSEGPSLMGRGMEGFGSSAWTVGDRLFVSTYAGNLQSLDSGAEAWSIARTLEDDRFFHRMLPFQGQLLLVGGASMKSGKKLHFETVELSSLK